MSLTLANVPNNVVADAEQDAHPEILTHKERFDFIPANRGLSAVEVGLMNVMNRETVLRR